MISKYIPPFIYKIQSLKTRIVTNYLIPLFSKQWNILNENVFVVYLKCLDFDKYGRLLAEIYTHSDVSFSQHLLDNKLAYKYTGQTKLTETEQLDVME